MKIIHDPTIAPRGGKSAPQHVLHCIGFAYVLNLAALDIGIELYNAKRRGDKHLHDDDEVE